MIKHFVLDRCIDVAFGQLTYNFIKPNIQSDKIRQYIDRIKNHFPEYQLNSISVVDIDGNYNRYTHVNDIPRDKYYRNINFNELARMVSQ